MFLIRASWQGVGGAQLPDSCSTFHVQERRRQRDTLLNVWYSEVLNNVIRKSAEGGGSHGRKGGGNFPCIYRAGGDNLRAIP